MNRQGKPSENEGPVEIQQIPVKNNVIDWRPALRQGQQFPQIGLSQDNGQREVGEQQDKRDTGQARFSADNTNAERSAPLYATDNFDPEVIDYLANPALVVKVLPQNRFTIVHLNKAHENMSGLRLADIKGLAFEDWLPADIARSLAGIYKHCREIRQPYNCDEIRSLPGGEKHWKTSLSPVCDSKGNVTHIISTAFEFTREFKAHQDEVRKHKQLLSKYQEYRDNFSTAAHDLRSPICQLDSVIKLLTLHNDRQGGQDNHELLQASQDLIANLLQHLDAVLRKSQPDGPGEDGHSRIELHKLCGDILTMLDPMEKTAHDFQEISVTTEKTLLQIVLRNLLDNAIKHNSQMDNLKISVSVQQIGTNMLQFFVEDNGKGLSDENQTPGSILPQASNGRNDTPHGLSTIKRMILAHDGDMGITNRKNGLTVHFILHGNIVSPTRH